MNLSKLRLNFIDDLRAQTFTLHITGEDLGCYQILNLALIARDGYGAEFHMDAQSITFVFPSEADRMAFRLRGGW